MPKEEFQKELRRLMTILETTFMNEEEKQRIKIEIKNLKEMYKHSEYAFVEEQRKRGK